MDGGDCDPEDVNENYFDPSGPDNRWWEAKNHVFAGPGQSQQDTECDDSEADDPMLCPSPGDLNNGLAGKGP
jgi:hypothetical protein